MLRTGMDPFLPWSSKTMTMIQTEQADECEACLRGIPSVSLFDPQCTDQDAEILFAASFFKLEDKHRRLHSIEELKKLVMNLFPAELALLSCNERDLMMKLMFFSHQVPLHTDNDICAGYQLVRRLWCKILHTEKGLALTLPLQLRTAALILLGNENYKNIRNLLDSSEANIRNTLYLAGMVQEKGPFDHLRGLLAGTPASDPMLLKRYFHCEYDYCYDRLGQEVLIHPGLASLDILESMNGYHGDAMVEMDEASLIAAIDSLDQLEKPVYDRVLANLKSHIRPELSAEESAEDLLILAKQNVSSADMVEAASSMVVGLASQELKKSVLDLHDRIPRWITMTTGRLQ